MGPVTLFDKSFLQSLSLDESVWFDHFFLANVAPLFFAETLADLSKPSPATAEVEVRRIADKFPDLHGTPNVPHRTLATANLLGQRIPMTGQTMVSGGRPVRKGETTGIVFDQPPEREAFARWQRRAFADVERDFAKQWRMEIANLDLSKQSELFRTVGVNPKTCRSLEQAKELATAMVEERSGGVEAVRLAATLLGVPNDVVEGMVSRHRDAGAPALSQYAPYASFMLTVDTFFHIALAAGLIGAARPSNRIDIGYLYYLPFCMMFVSNDALHRRCAPLFLRDDQRFVWGVDLKADLGRINEHFLRLPEETRKRGILSFAPGPPLELDTMVANLWDELMPGWRESSAPVPMSQEDTEQLVQSMRELMESPRLPPDEVDFDDESATAMSMSRMVRRKKGSWWQMPHDLVD